VALEVVIAIVIKQWTLDNSTWICITSWM